VKNNVFITHRQNGKVVDRREGHNVVVDLGRQYLAEMLGFTSQDPDVVERSDRVKYMGFGVGGSQQSNPAVSAAPFSTTYPAGSDPNTTTGTEHDHLFPSKPLGSVGGVIMTLERPVRIAGGSASYPGDPGDQWLSTAQSPYFITTHPSLIETRFHAFFDASAGDFLYGPYSSMPLSEAGLFTSAATALGVPFNQLVAYHNFATIVLSPQSELEVIWDVRF
jgi:hypothetical protein